MLHLNCIHISTLRFKIKTNKPALKNVKEREDSSNTLEIHSKKGSAAQAWRLKMQAMAEIRLGRDEVPIWADDVN